jgi:hypothetical protein
MVELNVHHQSFAAADDFVDVVAAVSLWGPHIAQLVRAIRVKGALNGAKN